MHSSANPLFASAGQVFGDSVIAQDEASSQVFAMPHSAITTGAVNAILPLAAIAPELERLAKI